jgi:hypothetical protein
MNDNFKKFIFLKRFLEAGFNEVNFGSKIHNYKDYITNIGKTRFINPELDRDEIADF